MRRILFRIAVVLEQLIVLAHAQVIRRIWRGPRDIQIVPYRGYGTTQTLYVLGRVLTGKMPHRAAPTDHWRRNFFATVRRFYTHEAPGVTVQISYAGVTAQTVSDNEGYFRCALKVVRPLVSPPAWRQVALELARPDADDSESVRTSAEILAPLSGSQFAVISDIDDTILTSNATRLWQMLRLVLFENAHTRLPFPGVAAFYRALQQGSQDGMQNPLFYLSSSPWNLYDFLVEFMELNGLPSGPILLADYGLDRGKFIHPSHTEHKETHIRRLLDTYPTLTFLLIGDSGQHDPEIYHNIVDAYPNRIGAVYIRNVSSEQRAGEIAALAESARAHDVDILLVKDTMAAAEHALARGWITASSLAAIRADVDADTEDAA